MNPLISVVIPTYNRAHIIKDSIDSVLAQDYDNIELIIVDDRSSDNTKEIIDSYHNNRIRYIYNDTDKHGAGNARNIGICEATGEYIAFNDSDDKWLPGKLTSQYSFLKKTNSDIVFCLMKLGSMIIPDRFSDKKCTLEYILRGNIPGPPSIMGKAECFKNTLFDEDMESYEDNDWVIRLFEKYKISFLKEVYVDIHASENSVSANYERNARMLEYIMDKHKRLYACYKKSRAAAVNQIKYTNALTVDQKNQAKLKESRRTSDYWAFILGRINRYYCVMNMMRYR